MKKLLTAQQAHSCRLAGLTATPAAALTGGFLLFGSEALFSPSSPTPFHGGLVVILELVG
jgi:hypothetical protein